MQQADHSSGPPQKRGAAQLRRILHRNKDIPFGPPQEERRLIPHWRDAFLECTRSRPFSARLSEVQRAKVFPQRALERVDEVGLYLIDGGVFFANGEPCPLALPLRSGDIQFPRRTAPDEGLRQFPGVSLFAGFLHPHFGQFLAHCLGRLWALEELREQVDRIVFVHHLGHRVPATPERQAQHAAGMAGRAHVRSLLRHLAGEVPVEVVSAPSEFERLIVPEPLTSHDVFTASPEVRRIWERLGQSIDSDTDRTDGFGAAARFMESRQKIYISRSRLAPPSAFFILEEQLEDNLRAAGYSIFHPQLHPFEEQLRTMRYAETIIAAEGSAIHLLAMVARPTQRIAIIQRRPEFDRFVKQLRGAQVSAAHAIDCVSGRVHAVPGTGRDKPLADSVTPATLDFPRLHEQLRELGFLSDSPWVSPDQNSVAGAVVALAERWPRKRRNPPWKFVVHELSPKPGEARGDA
jgi:hypothetical protein